MKKIINLLIFIGLILGVILGLILPEIMKELSFIGTIYINLLKFIIAPILFTTIMSTIYNSYKSKNKIILKSVVTFIIMFIITFLITSLVFVILNPTKGFSYNFIEWTGETTKFNLAEIIVNLFPSNIITIFQNNSIFSIILLSILCGISAAKIKNGNKLVEIVNVTKDLFNRILEYIMYLTPIGVFSLIGSFIANYGSSIIGLGAKYIGMAYLCSVIVMFIVMILPVWFIAKINPVIYIKKICSIWLMTLTTCSSAATLPLTIKTCNEKLNIPSKITDIVVPLGCTIHMCGGAVSFALLGLFCSSIFGTTITLSTYLLMILSATLINMAAPGIPNGGIVIGASYLSLLGIPLTFIGFYSGIYKILDMSYTTLNVTGDITANVLINYSERRKK